MQGFKLLLRGTVQGVGFRQTVYRIATQLGLKGWVRNTSQGVEVVITSTDIDNFIFTLNNSLPRLAQIDSIEQSLIQLETKPDNFLIAPSSDTATNEIIMPVDSNTCKECLADVFNLQSKYFHYPFTGCSNCGPRYTVVKNLPYDRNNTTMVNFPLCESCLKEYTDPNNRRYHSDITSCPDCGPKLDMDLAEVAKRIISGQIVALKTTGGYTLIADAANTDTILRLRKNKNRKTKPFALMALNTQSIKDYYCTINLSDQLLLESISAPILILPRNPAAPVSKEVSPGINTLGFMLPSSPIYYLLLYYLLGEPQEPNWLEQGHELALVVTSANLSGGSIISDNAQARSELAPIADIIVGYNREIVMKCDDSVVLPIRDHEIIIRKARGLTLKPYLFKYKLPQVLGLGAHLKNTICFTRDNQAFLSQYLGDMDSQHTITYFHQLIQHYQNIFSFTPELIVSDMHPDFYTSLYAEESDLSHLQLQHHYAHLAATIASVQSFGLVLHSKIIGCVLDGYGYGIDGGCWGGELIEIDLTMLEFSRLSHLPLLSIPAGSSGKKDPWKLALIWCLHHNLNIPEHIMREPQREAVTHLIKNNQVTQTSSCGDIFSLVSALLGICCHSSYEAEAALRLESMVTYPELESEYVQLTQEGKPDIRLLIERVYHIAYIYNDIIRAVNVFYANLAAVLGQWIIYHARLNNVSQVALSGGCWQSRFLLTLLYDSLDKSGIKLLTPYNLPYNDECISLGQAWYGAQYILLGKS